MTQTAQPTLTPQKWAVGAALAVFGAGFLAMNLFWFIGSWDAHGRGLYTFKSATLGDGLVLPFLMYLLIRIGRWQDPMTAGARIVVSAGALTGLAGGVLTQVQWLHNSNVRLNWTIPAPGDFNWPGWWHALFLCAACGAFAGALTRAAIAGRASTSVPHIRLTWEFGVTLVALPLFPALLRADFLRSNDSAQTILAAGGAVSWIPLFVLFTLGWERRRQGTLTALAGASTAVFIPLLLVYAPAVPLRLGAALFTICLFSANFALPLWRTAEPRQLITVVTILFTTSSALGLYLWASGLVGSAIVWLLALASIFHRVVVCRR